MKFLIHAVSGDKSYKVPNACRRGGKSNIKYLIHALSGENLI